MRLYLAGRYQEQVSMRAWRTVLENNGHSVTSRWIDGKHDGAPPVLCAVDDCEDIDAAEALILFSPKHLHGSGRGGRHVELGYAIGTGKRVILVGDRENVFHSHPAVEYVADPNDLLSALSAAAHAPDGAMMTDPATRAREIARNIVWRWRNSCLVPLDGANTAPWGNLICDIAAALTEPGRGPATGPDVARLREAVKTCEEILQMALQSLDTFAFRTARERVAMVQEELARILATANKATPGSEAPATPTPDGPDGEPR